MPITDILIKNAQLYPDDISLVELNPGSSGVNYEWREFRLVEPAKGGTHRFEMTWKQFNDMANRIANMLISRGIDKDNKVGILMMNSLEWLPIYFGVLKTGAVVVPLNFRYTADEIEHCLNLAEVDMLFFGEEFIGRLDEIHDKVGRVKSWFYVGETAPDYAELSREALSGSSSVEPEIEFSDDDFAVIYFSSGTTGFPKAILHKHKSLMSAVETEQTHHGQTKEDVFLCIPPLYHTGAKMHWFGSFRVGGKAVLLRGVKPEWVLDAVSEEKATIVWLLVPWAQDILDAIDSGAVNIEDYELDQWRLMHIGAQPVPPSLIKRWKEHFPHHDYDTNYGLSESIGPGCVHLGIENIHKVGAIGIPGYKWQARIVDTDGNEVKDGEVGELIVKGDGVMTCYFNDPQATAETLKDGWLYTGDMAKKDEDGFIFLVDRKKDVIICGGENIYPVQIEDFLRSYEEIKDAAVIGFPDHRLGEIPGAIIELRDGSKATEEDIAYFCKELPRYKRPRRIIIAPIPRNPTGKIEKPKLRSMYCGPSIVESQTKG